MKNSSNIKTFRIGNEIHVRWPILTNGKPTPLTDRDLTLFLTDPYDDTRQVVFETENNFVYYTYSPLEQKLSGVYRLTLFENRGTERQLCVDALAFRLVPHTDDIPANMAAEELELGARDITAIRGRSAYEIAVAYGYEGTEEEWAAQYNTVLTSVGTMVEQVQESRNTLDRCQELEHTLIEIENVEYMRAQEELRRVEAERGRAAAEQGRVDAERARVEAEQGRVSAEQARVDEERERNVRSVATQNGMAAYEERIRQVIDEIENISEFPISDRRRTMQVIQTESTVEIQPNVMNIWPEPMAVLEVTFATGVSGYENEYMMRFTCPDDEPTELYLPDVTYWANGSPLEPEKGWSYEISVIDGRAAYAEYEPIEE